MWLLLLHNVVPHQHHDEGIAEEHCLTENSHDGDNLLELLGDIFHTDLGNDHLENLRKTESSQPSLILPTILAEVQKPIEVTVRVSSGQHYPRPENLALPEFSTDSAHPLRGPPTCVQA